MSDELLVRMKTAVGAGQMIKALDEGAAEIERLRDALAATAHLYDEIGGVRTCYEFDDDPAAWTAMAMARYAALKETP